MTGPAIVVLTANGGANAMRLKAGLGGEVHALADGLQGDLAGRHSIRVNREWRVVFRWETDGAHEVTLTDYH